MFNAVLWAKGMQLPALGIAAASPAGAGIQRKARPEWSEGNALIDIRI